MKCSQNNYKLIIFDLSNVCFSSEEPPFIKKFCREHHFDEKKFDLEYQALVEKAEVGKISGYDIWKILIPKYDINDTPKNIIKEMIELRVAYKATLAVAKKLKKLGYSLAYLTNYSRDYWRPIAKKFNLKEYFSGGLVSYEIKARKPAVKGFRVLMKKFKASPQETIFIDDSSKNLKMAEKLGIKTYQFVSVSRLKSFLIKEGLFNFSKLKVTKNV